MYDEDKPRGSIKYPKAYKQSKNIDFSGLVRRGNVTPTDIDGSYDLDERFYVTLEAKKKGVHMESGQKRYFEGLIKMIAAASLVDHNYIGYVVVFEHDIPSDEIIHPENLPVVAIIDSETLQWYNPENSITVKEQLDKCEEHYFRLRNQNFNIEMPDRLERIRNFQKIHQKI
jgi:hypothetical protein